MGIENPNQARSAILSATNGNLAAIPGTFIVNQESENTFTGHGFLQKANVALPITASVKMTAIAKNVLMDETDNSIWDIVNQEGNVKHLVKRLPDEDLSSLVCLASANEHIVKSYALPVQSVKDLNTIANYVIPDKAEASFGVVVSSTDTTLNVFDYNYRKHLEIPMEAALLMSDVSDDSSWVSLKETVVPTLSKEVQSSLMQNEVSYADVRDYYGAMYNYAPEYFEQFLKIIEDYGF
jgi:hypothetical protein